MRPKSPQNSEHAQVLEDAATTIVPDPANAIVDGADESSDERSGWDSLHDPVSRLTTIAAQSLEVLNINLYEHRAAVIFL